MTVIDVRPAFGEAEPAEWRHAAAQVRRALPEKAGKPVSAAAFTLDVEVPTS